MRKAPNPKRATKPPPLKPLQPVSPGTAAPAAPAGDLERLRAELREAVEQQMATSEVLKIISRATSDLQPVFDTIVDSVVRLCHADYASFWRPHAEGFRMVADNFKDAEFAAMLRTRTVMPSRGSITGRAALERRVVHLPDVFADAELEYRATPTPGSAQSALGVPIVRGDEVVGIIAIGRSEIQPFSENEIDLVRTFADQAAIAIENVRLFNETKEALEQQTAVSRVLESISRSAFELQSVLDTVLEVACRLCDAQTGFIFRRDGARLRRVGTFGYSAQQMASFGAGEFDVDRGTTSGRVVITGDVVHILDLELDLDISEAVKGRNRPIGVRTIVGVPIIREQEVIGVFSLRRSEVQPFTDRQIRLVRTFADQAAIAIENTRLFNEIKEKSRQLEAANADLDAASRHKSEFLANMSHELRTPLNAIIGFSDVLEQRMFGELNERQAEYLRDIAGSGRHLLALVNEILDLAKVEAGRMELEPNEFDLAETIRGAVGLIRERAGQHGITLATDLPAELGTLLADERKIRQVLLNLLSNAVKFTPDGGTITVGAGRIDGAVQVSVRDTGVGIAPADQPRVFEEFQQVGTKTDRSREGTGLGLTLAKRFVELHGGRIWLESALGEGTTFTFRIPTDRPSTRGLP